MPILLGVVASAPGCARRGDEVHAGDLEGAWLVEMTRERGLAFVHESGAAGQHLMPEIMGGGCAFLDLDGDGRLDVYLVNGNRAAAGDATPCRNAFWHQEAGGRFVDATASSGLGDAGFGMGVAVGDVDNDGRDDVYVTNDGPDRLYRNVDGTRVNDVTRAAGVDVDGWSTSAAYLDFDQDGFLDLYVARYVVNDPGKRCTMYARPDYCGPLEYAPIHDVLLHNRGDGGFEDVSRAAGIASRSCAGLGVACEDFDDDGRIDVYVANDAYANQLWLNQGDGTFVDRALHLGAAYNGAGEAEAGMGVVASDLDGDARPDLFITHLVEEKNTLYRNLGPGAGFTDCSAKSGLAASSIPFTGFGVLSIDLELDGDQDLLVANGRVKRGPRDPRCRLAAPWIDYAEANLAYLGDGNGAFVEAGPCTLAFTAEIQVSRGLAAGDVDGDGDLDLLLTAIQGPARLYRNDAPRAGAWLRVRALDPRYGRDAVGAVLWLHAGGRVQRRCVNGAQGYLSHSEPVVTFGIPHGVEPERLEVRWPDGRRERFAVPGTNRELVVRRGEGEDA